MWKQYLTQYIRENRATSIFLAGMSFVASLLLSLFCGIAYNLWVDYVNRQKILYDSYTPQMEPILAAYGSVLLIACAALVSMLHHAFAVSMNSRMHQLGILASVGATPVQIKRFLISEALSLCGIPILVGIVAGIGLCYGFMEIIIRVARRVVTYAEGYEVSFAYHVLVACTALLCAFLTVFLSAWIPARKISKISPLVAIHYGEDAAVRKMRRFSVFSKLSGVYGELARKSLYARRRMMQTSTFSLTLSCLALFSFLSVETISGNFTQMTYFERFHDTWDFMLTVTGQEDTKALLSAIRELQGVDECVAYRRIYGTTEVFVLDEESFHAYCDSGEVMPKIREEISSSIPPQVIPETAYRDTEIWNSDVQVNYNIRLRSDASHEGAKRQLEALAAAYLPAGTSYSLEGRIEEEASDASIRAALRFFIGVLAALLAAIGIMNVFSATLGQLYQRRREFARYLSVGMSPQGMWRILGMEAMLISLTPILLGVLANVPLVWWALGRSGTTLGRFFLELPMGMILTFLLFLLGSIGLAYALGGRRIVRTDIIETLRDETMV